MYVPEVCLLLMKWLAFVLPAPSLGIVSVCGVCACVCLVVFFVKVALSFFPITGFGIAYAHYLFLLKIGFW